MASRPAEAPWLESEGFSDQPAVHAYRAFSSFLLGHLLLEVAGLGADLGPLDVIDDGEGPDKSLVPYSTVARLRVPLTEDHSAVEFEEALEELLNRISLVQAEV